MRVHKPKERHRVEANPRLAALVAGSRARCAGRF